MQAPAAELKFSTGVVPPLHVKVFHGGYPPHMIAARELSCYHVRGSRYCARHDRAMELIMVVKIGINIVLCMCEKMKAISLKASELQAMKEVAE